MSPVISQLIVYGVLGLVGWVGAKLHTAATKTTTPTPTPTPTPASSPAPSAASPSPTPSLLTTIESALQGHLNTMAISLVENAVAGVAEKQFHLPSGTLTSIVNGTQLSPLAPAAAASAVAPAGALAGSGGAGVEIPIQATAHVAVKPA